jgi:hypothetical protein
MLDPGVLHHNDAVAHARDEVDEISVSVDFGQPNGITNFAMKAALLEDGEHF